MVLRTSALPVFAITAVVLAVAACTTVPAPPPLADGCNADAIKQYVGQPASPETVDAARKAAGAELARVLRPGQPATMDYRADRINILLDEHDRIARATCG